VMRLKPEERKSNASRSKICSRCMRAVASETRF
jgi:hypothetical protein